MMDGSRRSHDSSDETIAIYNHYAPAHVRLLAEALGCTEVIVTAGFWEARLPDGALVGHRIESDSRGCLAAYHMHHSLMQLVLSGVIARKVG